MCRKILILLCAMALGFIVSQGCGGSAATTPDDGKGDGLAPQTPAQIPTAIEGVVQKGPFIQGSSITISELDSNFDPTGNTYDVQTDDDVGSFELGTQLSTQHVEIIGSGYYYNEVIGDEAGEITLRTISDITENADIRVNILTTLAKNRIVYLIEDEDMTFSEARAQVEEEVLSIFNISEDELLNFDEMDISKDGTANAILLAVSVALQGDNEPADLQSLISDIASDLEEDGTLDNQTYIDEICDNMKGLNLEEIRENLENRYDELGVNATIPPFEDYVDSDCDGENNKDDDETWMWIEAGDLPYWYENENPALDSTVEIFDNKVWVMRGSGHGGLDDVYSSIDGIIYNWLTDSVGWDGLNNPVSAVFNETIWLIDGNALIPQTWYSFDGSSWTLGTGAPVWKNNVFGYKVAVFENKMWLIGYESGNGFNVWNTSDGFDWEFVVNIDSFGTTLSDMVAYDGKLIFFVGPDVYYSDDGTNWENTSINQLAEINNYTVESFAGKLWIVAAGDHFFYSEDGITWQEDSGVIFPWGGDIDDQLSFVFDNKLWVLGGKAAGLSNTNIWSFTNYADQ